MLTLPVALPLAGCASHARVTILSSETNAKLDPALTTRVYTYSDANTVDIYLTDLTPDQINLTGDATGHIVHIHMFLRPSPGRTPIDPTATNATLRHLVLSGGRAGLYAGGGFLQPKGTPDSERFGGKLTGASVVLLQATDGFADLLGPSKARASFLASRDDPMARRYQVAFERVTAKLSGN